MSSPVPANGLPRLPSYLAPQDISPWTMFLDQVDRIEPHLGALGKWVDTLRRPKRILTVDVPIQLESGRIAHFEGWRVHHNTSRGPAKGGIRYHPDANLAEVMALAGWMSVKNALVNLPYGGGKGAIRIDPATLTMGELERLTRRYTTEIATLLGPDKDIPAPDVNTNPQIMAWIMDTYSMTAGQMTTGVVTGKPVSLGGSLGRSSATGRGVLLTGARAAKAINLPLEGARIAVQGFGNVGAASARFFHAAGGKIVGIQDMAGTLLNETGIDPDGLSRHLASGGSMTTFDGAELVAKDDFWSLASDILVPAALENQITSERARKLRTRLIVEGANGPTTSEAQDILTERGVTVVPDVLANSGGVIVSYFEWVQDFSSFFWNESEIDQRLRSIIEPAFDATWELAETSKLPLRSAAYLLACKRILQARSERGLYP